MAVGATVAGVALALALSCDTFGGAVDAILAVCTSLAGAGCLAGSPVPPLVARATEIVLAVCASTVNARIGGAFVNGGGSGGGGGGSRSACS